MLTTWVPQGTECALIFFRGLCCVWAAGEPGCDPINGGSVSGRVPVLPVGHSEPVSGPGQLPTGCSPAVIWCKFFMKTKQACNFSVSWLMRLSPWPGLLLSRIRSFWQSWTLFLKRYHPLAAPAIGASVGLKDLKKNKNQIKDQYKKFQLKHQHKKRKRLVIVEYFVTGKTVCHRALRIPNCTGVQGAIPEVNEINAIKSS